MSAKRTVLIVEDDSELRATLVEAFAAGEFEAIGVGTCAAALAAVAAPDARFAAMILACHLSDGDGKAFCAQLRRAQCRLPIILTGTDELGDVVSGLNAGANDYAVKPFRLSVLVARLRVQLRLADNSAAAVLPLGPYTFRPADKLLIETVTGRRIAVSAKESALLKFLLHRSAPTPTEMLLQEVWGYHPDVESHTVAATIYRLRQKLKRGPGRDSMLSKGFGGYRLALSDVAA